ncbi:MAG: DNA polymerase III subunit beta [Patescibacteria group bacterium]|nr:DNA polymerase III subunit beta [Patescibacteria group bacterium]
MKAEVRLEKLKGAVALTERAAGKHSTLPVLSCILIDAKKNSLTLRATNLDIGIEVDIPSKSDGEASFAVPAHTLSSFLSQAGDKDQIATLESSNGNLSISLSRSRGVLKTMPFEDFPAIPTVAEGKSYSIAPEVFIRGLKAVWYSASVSSVKPELSSIYVYRDADEIVFAATDSFRLAEKRLPLPKNTPFDDVLIPFKNSVDIARALETVSGEVSVKAAKNLISFESEGTKITSRVIDGVFPDYKQIIPKGYVTEAIVLKQDLMNALKVSSVFSDAFNQVKMTIDPEKKSFEVMTKNSDIGENLTGVDASLSGEAIEVNFNCKYITDCFQSIDADSLSLQLNGKNRPLVIRPVSGSGDRMFMYIVMPMNR